MIDNRHRFQVMFTSAVKSFIKVYKFSQLSPIIVSRPAVAVDAELNKLKNFSHPRLNVLSDKELLSVKKPAQYLGGEHNSVHKNDADVDLHFALTFPDTYEVGMSHIGLQILYEQVNGDRKAWAERAYMPFPDMESILRERGLPLCSLESKRPLSNFDIVGFSLQYELCATSILAMLDLGGIPRYARDRGEDDPLIIGGGPYTYHPEAIADFFDLFFLGDAEEAIYEISACVRAWKEKRRSGDNQTRSDLIESLSKIEGIYIPSRFEPLYDELGRLSSIRALDASRPVVTRRLLPSMSGAPYAKRPIVPNVDTVHNRLSIEVMRGCVRGCRFCQAGYLYRPQRERSPEEILEMVQEVLPNTGFEELSLLSLSTADYCSVVPLLKELMNKYAVDDRLAVSFPSTRVDALTPEVLEQVQRVRRTGFTVAPEAGTQRLRDVINKGVSDEQILETCRNVFTMGWTGIKLYFMLGLPTETDEDLLGIVDIARRIKALPEAKRKDITVSVSTHVPKPHTPFQWAEQISPAETVRKQHLLADHLRRVGVNFRYHNAFSSFLEGTMCRADRRLGRVIERAYELGCRLDGWTEHLSEELWTQAFQDSGIDPFEYLRARSLDEHLPWDHLSCGIPKSYFRKEFERAVKSRVTPDCLTQSCSICGACDYDSKKNILWPRGETEKLFANSTNAPRSSEEPRAVTRIRLTYAKSDGFRLLGHLELAHVFQRSLRRAGLPVAFSKGFHPLPRTAFGPPLQLGIASEEEFVDIYLTAFVAPEQFIRTLNDSFASGLRAIGAKYLPLSAPSLQEEIIAQRFRLTWATQPKGILGDVIERTGATENFSDWEMFESELSGRLIGASIERLKEATRSKRGETKRQKTQSFELTQFVSSLSVGRDEVTNELQSLEFNLRTEQSIAGPKATEVATSLLGLEYGDIRIEKLATFFRQAASQMQHQNVAVAG